MSKHPSPELSASSSISLTHYATQTYRARKTGIFKIFGCIGVISYNFTISHYLNPAFLIAPAYESVMAKSVDRVEIRSNFYVKTVNFPAIFTSYRLMM